MTAITEKAKENINKSFDRLRKMDGMQAVFCFFLGFSGGRGIWCDTLTSGLVTVMAGSTTDFVMKFSIIAGGLLSCGFKAIRDFSYLPYFLSYIFYTVVYRLLNKEKYSLMAAFGVQAMVEIMLGLHLSFYYKGLILLKAVVLYFITLVAQTGIKEIKNGQIEDFTDFVSLFVTMAVIRISLSGVESRVLYAGASFALATGWLFSAYGRLSSAAAVTFVLLTVLVDKQAFTMLFIGFLVLWLIGGFMAEKMLYYIYPLTAIIAFGINIIYIGQLNSFALTGSTILALIIYTALPYILPLSISNEKTEFTQGRDWRILMVSLRKLEESLRFLANCIIDISRLNEKNLRIENLEDMVAQDVCSKCEKSSFCWQEKFSFTQQQFSEYGKKMYWSGEKKFSVGFYSQCINVEKITTSFEENSRLLLSKKYILQSQKNNQRLLQNAFLSVSSAVGDIIYKNQHSYLINSTITMELEKYLNNIAVSHSYCICSQNPDQACFSVFYPLEEKVLYKIQLFLENIYGVKFQPAVAEKQDNELLYVFSSCPLFSYDISVKSSAYREVNGDNYDYFTVQDKLYVLLSDGMGTGAMAAAESRTVISMAQSLIKTGISVNSAVNIINLALNLKSGGESSASLDILQIDLFTGNSVITKAGAGVSIVIDRQGITRYYRDSLPLGILKDVKLVESNFALKSGDTILIMSDGAGVVSNKLKEMYAQPVEEIAQTIIEETETKDDKTVIAIRLKIK